MYLKGFNMSHLIKEVSDRDFAKENLVPQCLNGQNKDDPNRLRCDKRPETAKHQSSSSYPLMKTSKYDCGVCGKQFWCAVAFQRHVMKHGGVRNFKCKLCSQGFAAAHLLKKHAVTHSTENLYQCYSCSKVFKRHAYLVNHKFDTHGIGYQCNLCPQKFPTTVLLKEHEKTHATAKAHECDRCSEAFKSQFCLASHKFNVFGMFRECLCEMCGKIVKELNGHKCEEIEVLRGEEISKREEAFGKAYEPQEGLAENAQGRRNKCEECGSAFKTRAGLRLHQSFGHEETGQQDAEKLYKCKQCFRVFKTQDQLAAHKEEHGIRAEFPCVVCRITFDHPSQLANHTLWHKSVKCDLCSEMFFSEQQLSEHKNYAHVSTKHFQCDLCPETFANHHSLTAHKRVHHDPDSRFSCQSCGKRYLFPNASGNLIYKCDQCNNTYKFLKNLISHKYHVHSERALQCEGCSTKLERKEISFSIDNFECEVCHEAFTTQYYLTNHKMVEHAAEVGFPCQSCGTRVSFSTLPGSEEYKCDRCEFTFKTTRQLVLHKQRAHSQRLFRCDDCSEGLRKLLGDVIPIKHTITKTVLPRPADISTIENFADLHLTHHKQEKVETVEEVFMQEEQAELYESEMDVED